MELKEKVYEALVVNNYFNQDTKTVIIKLSKTLGESANKIAEAIKELSKEQRIKSSKTSLENNSALFASTFMASKKNFGFVSVDGETCDLFVANRKGAFNGDIVEVGFIYNHGRKEAFISKIIERKNTVILGQIVKDEQNKLIFVPDDRTLLNSIVISQNESSKNALGKKVAIKADFFDTNGTTFIYGSVDKVFGTAGDPIVENQAIAYEYGFVKEFSEDVENEVVSLSDKISSSELAKRLDLRDKHFITIDPKNCKDMDDAVHIEKTQNGYKVYVAIADVAHYVKRGTAVDKEAYKRGTSCYLGDGVYPMLPEKLSNDICSLNPNVDRLALCAIVDIDNNGNTTGYEIKKAVINSKHKLSYEKAEEIHFATSYPNPLLKNNIDIMYEASDALTKMRDRRGSVSFKNTEPSFKYSDNKCEVEEVVNNNEVTSKKIIESFMILANEAVGNFFTTNHFPVLYRVHDGINEQKFNSLAQIFSSFKIPFSSDKTSHGIKKVLKGISGSKYEDYLNGAILRAFSKAKYQPENIGHFGLASTDYIHFTSPIRRYPDTLTHRLLTEYLEYGEIKVKNKDIESMGMHLSEQEKKAQNAEIKSDALLKAMWAENHVGEIFEGYVSGVEQANITVRVGLVDFMVTFANLKDGLKNEYRPNHSNTAVTNRQTGLQYKIGDPITVRIEKADRSQRLIFATTNLEAKLQQNADNLKTNDLNDLFI